MQRQGSIFQDEFLGEVQFKKSFKKWTFEPKIGAIFEKDHKKHDFLLRWGSIQEWPCIEADMVCISSHF